MREDHSAGAGSRRGFAAGEGVAAVAGGGGEHTDVLARRAADGHVDRLTGEGRPSNSVLQESVQGVGLVNSRRVICCKNTNFGFLKSTDWEADHRGVRGGVGGVASEGCLVVIIARRGFAESEGVGAVGGGGGGAVGAPGA